MKTFLIFIGIVILAAAALLTLCAWALHKTDAEEQEEIRILMEDDRLSCGLIEED